MKVVTLGDFTGLFECGERYRLILPWATCLVLRLVADNILGLPSGTSRTLSSAWHVCLSRYSVLRDRVFRDKCCGSTRKHYYVSSRRRRGDPTNSALEPD